MDFCDLRACFSEQAGITPAFDAFLYHVGKCLALYELHHEKLPV